MRLLMLLMIQSPPPLDFDLQALPRDAPSCAAGGGGTDILVCARRTPPPSLRLPDRAEGDALPKAEARLFGQVRGSLHGDQANVGGFTSNRAMVTVTVPF